MKIILVNHIHDKEFFKMKKNYITCLQKYWFVDNDLIEIIDTKNDTYKKITVSEKNGKDKKELSLLDKIFYHPDKCYYNKIKISN